MPRQSTSAIGVAFLFILTNCASVGVQRLNSAQSKAADCNLKIFLTESEIKEPYESVCLLDAKTSTSMFSDHSMAGAIDHMKPEACKCGADAMLIIGGRSEGMSFWTNGQGFATAKAIRFTKKDKN